MSSPHNLSYLEPLRIAMDGMDDVYNNYWETSMFFDTQEVDSWDIDIEEAFSSYFNSSSPDAGPTPSASPPEKNIVMERKRRKRFNDSLYSLRSVVPNITKMDKASIIKDAIGYIEDLQEQERRMVAEIMELESSSPSSRGDERSPVSVITDHEKYLVLSGGSSSSSSRKKMKRSDWAPPGSPENPSIQVMELKVCEVGERSQVISMSCCKKSCSSVTKLSKLFESLNLNIITANITSLSETLLVTLFVEIEDMNSAQLKEKIEVSIAELDVATSTGSSVSF